MKRVLVTGATGFLGGVAARRMHTAGYDVLCTGRNIKAGQGLTAVGLTFVAADLCQPDALHALCQGVDVVVHSAALSSPWGPADSFTSANITASENLLLAAERAGVKRFVHISTPGIYFDHSDRFNVREDDPLPARSVNDYARTKLVAEQRVRAQRMPYIILRPRAIYGPGDTTLFPRLVRALGRGRLPVIGKGDNFCDLTYVDNVCDAIVAAVESGPEACGYAYNITDGQPVLLWELIARLARTLELPQPKGRLPVWAALAMATAMEAVYRLAHLRGEPLLTRYGVGLLGSSMTLDISRAREKLGYAPAVGLDEGLDRFVRWYREQPTDN